MSIQMESSTSSATSSWPPRMCACGFGHCVVKISRSTKNPGRAFYVCPRTTMNNQCAKFRTKPLDHVDLMERVYFGAAVTGKHAWTPTEVQDDAAVATNAMDVDSGMGPLSADTPLHPGRDTVGENVVDSSLFEDAPPS
ncbi:hypothetical protein LOK49_LG02G03456 [Camellia lanceoleosa]|uniref:Uncharacterized protein n=1 Tax=Camellia lanceoleosa TaxID=1840588 RepID=A0ACC0IN44_9ERIC|nr:hypothetical protein LOK49_LG02G03456 [Camellia lanceoleosa]